jgi:hypothetical protein
MIHIVKAVVTYERQNGARSLDYQKQVWIGR